MWKSSSSLLLRRTFSLVSCHCEITCTADFFLPEFVNEKQKENGHVYQNDESIVSRWHVLYNFFFCKFCQLYRICMQLINMLSNFCKGPMSPLVTFFAYAFTFSKSSTIVIIGLSIINFNYRLRWKKDIYFINYFLFLCAIIMNDYRLAFNIR